MEKYLFIGIPCMLSCEFKTNLRVKNKTKQISQRVKKDIMFDTTRDTVGNMTKLAIKKLASMITMDVER